MTPVFMDASSAILLEKATLFEPLSRVFTLVAARAVFDEITKAGYPGAASFIKAHRQGLFWVQSPPFIREGDLETGTLGPGEKQTICLFLEKKQGFVLTDDGKAARWCHKNQVPFINALLVPKLFWYAGLITQTQSEQKMKTLCSIGRYGEKVRAFAFSCTLNDLSFFIPGQKNVT